MTGNFCSFRYVVKSSILIYVIGLIVQILLRMLFEIVLGGKIRPRFQTAGNGRSEISVNVKKVWFQV